MVKINFSTKYQHFWEHLYWFCVRNTELILFFYYLVYLLFADFIHISNVVLWNPHPLSSFYPHASNPSLSWSSLCTSLTLGGGRGRDPQHLIGVTNMIICRVYLLEGEKCTSGHTNVEYGSLSQWLASSTTSGKGGVLYTPPTSMVKCWRPSLVQ